MAYATYGYNAFEQLVIRATSAAGGPTGTVHYIHDLSGHIIAEADAATGATAREYIWMAANHNEPTDLPMAVVEDVATTPVLLMVHTDHLGRPIRMTDGAKATVWQASYMPWGEPLSISGAKALNLRFPGQYFQIETSLAYNWHRHYDTTTGRYTQPDPLGFVDGPSVYAYAGNSPFMYVDPWGLDVQICCRAAQIAGGMVDHCWVRTGSKSAGMGANPGIRPGEEYEGLGMSVQIIDHSKDTPNQCTVQNNVDEQCVNSELILGKPLGRFLPPFNQCQSFAYGVVNKCRYGPQG